LDSVLYHVPIRGLEYRAASMNSLYANMPSWWPLQQCLAPLDSNWGLH